MPVLPTSSPATENSGGAAKLGARVLCIADDAVIVAACRGIETDAIKPQAKTAKTKTL